MMPSNPNQKEQNISSRESSDSPVDIISNLSDSVLSHILSFLPTTKEAVATSILSKRWKHVWTNVDNLVFVCYDLPFEEAWKQFSRSVYQVLNLHNGNIKGFTLSGPPLEYNELDAISWINTAISRGVERLHVDIDFRDQIPSWPLSIFSCKTLVDLKMWGFCGDSMDIPSTPIFPCLKKLHIVNCDTEFSKRIVSGCPALEHLVVYLDCENNFDIVSSSMKRLDLDCYMDDYVDYEIALCVPSLQYLKFYCALPLEFIVEEKLSSLIEADICFWDYRYPSRNVNPKELHDSFVKVMQLISNVKLLRINTVCNKFFNSIGDGVFANLIKLEIFSKKIEWRLLLSFMENSINLEAIHLKKKSTRKEHTLAWKEPEEVPTCLSSSLRKMSIHGYSGDELPMVTYVLRTAQILEQVDIHCAICYRDNNAWKSGMFRNLQKLQRASGRCEIVLV